MVEEIPIHFETITKDVSDGNNKETKVVQNGENGIKEITYKVKYQNEEEIEKVELSSRIVKEPVDKIVEVQTKKQVTTRSIAKTEKTVSKKAETNPATESNVTLAQKVKDITPQIVTLNASAYTASTCGKSESSPGYGVTASGSKASSWYTVAAGTKYPIGTVIYIPYFKNKPNGGWFVVQDRGVGNSKIDIYMNTYNECINFGRRSLECYVYI